LPLCGATIAVVAGRFGRATMEAIHNFKTNKPQTIAILKKYAKTDVTTLDTAHSYLKGAIPDLPNPTLKGRNKNDSHRDGPRRPGGIEI
jgi:hypothetical protein